ncbi:hypothetical protein WJX77_012217 [Trebouxia sp. C0004]
MQILLAPPEVFSESEPPTPPSTSLRAQQQAAELGLLGDFDQALLFEEADLDCLDELVGCPNDEGLQYLNSCGIASPCDITPASSFDTDLTHGSQQLLAEQPSSHPLLQSTKQRTKELNRRHQKRFREKQKAQKQKLEAELAQTKAALKHIQAESHSPSDLGLSLVLSTKHENRPLLPVICATGQVPDLPAPAALDASLAAGPRGGLSISSQNEAPTVAVIRQGYVKKMAKLLLVSGQDIAPQEGLQLGQLIQEFCTLHTLMARATPREWGRMFTGTAYAGQGDEEQALSQRKPDWPALLSICSSDKAKREPFFLTDARTLLTWRSYQSYLDNCTLEANRRYFEYMGSVGHDVMTMWQAFVPIIHAFPQAPDVLAMGNALAEEEGDPSAEPLHAAAVCSSPPATSGAIWSQVSALARMDDWTQN